MYLKYFIFSSLTRGASVPDLPQFNKKGFSLVELLVTLAILSVVTGIMAYSIIDWLPAMRLKSAARDLYSNMHRMKGLAVRDGEDRAIVFVSATDSYHLCTDAGAGGWADLTDTICTLEVSLADYKSGVQYGSASVTASVTGPGIPASNITYGSNVLVFNSRGTSNGGYVYLDQDPEGDGTATDNCFAVGTQTSGFIKLWRWKNGGWLQ